MGGPTVAVRGSGHPSARAGQTLKEKYPAAARIAENVLTPLVTTAVKMRLGWGG
jgi:hypothetical protein